MYVGADVCLDACICVCVSVWACSTEVNYWLVLDFNTYSLEFSGLNISLRPRIQFGWTGCLGFSQHQWSPNFCLTSTGIINVYLLLTFMEMLWIELQLCAYEYGQGYIFLLIALNFFFCKKCISVNSSFTPLANTHRAKTMCC